MKQELPRYIGKGLHDWLERTRRKPVPRSWFGLISRLEERELEQPREELEQKSNPASEEGKPR
jgi:hypothetical protein